MHRTPRILTFLLALILLLSSFVVGYAAGAKGSFNWSQPFQQIKTSSASADFTLLNDVWGILEKQYVAQPIDKTNAVYGAIHGLIASLKDPYTVFFSPDETKSFQEEIEGTFEGIGAEIGIKNEQLVIIAPLPSSPAERAGLIAGDQILSIDSVESKTFSLDEAVSHIRGAKGTAVVLLIQRSGEPEPKEISITREAITVQSVTTTYLDDGVAQITLSYFGPNTARDFQSAASEIVVKGSRGVLLDMRNNPGGYLDAAVSVASQFVQNGTPIVIEEAADGTKMTQNAQNGETLLGIPTVVLIDQGSASGSEIVAGALQDLHVATLVGAKTFGKGSVQQLEELPGGASLKVTIAKWLTPNGRSIHEQGITPDVTVERTEEDYNNDRDPQLDRAREALKEKIDGQ